MEVLGGSRAVHDLDVVVCAQLQEAFGTCTGVLGSGTLKAVRQQHDQSAQAVPLVLGTGDELVNDHLRRVDEIAILRFPDNEGIRHVE